MAEQKQRSRTNDRSTQTILQQETSCASKRQRDEVDKPGGTPTKKSRTVRPRGQVKTAAGAESGDSTGRTAAASSRIEAAPAVADEGVQEGNDWIVKTRKRKKLPRPDAVVIKPTKELSFADILRRVRNAPELKSVGEDVQLVKKTQRGEILLEFRRSTDVATETHRSKLRSLLTDDIEVRTITEEATFEIRYLDVVTTEEEIIAAWKDQIGEIHPSALKTIRDVPGGTRTAVITIPMKLASRAEEVSKLRVGWTVCRLLRKITPRRCFKCLEFGHVAGKCRSNSDWSRHCFRCGGQGHIAKTCDRDPHCLLCRDDPDADAKHTTGGHKCAHYLAARRKLKYAGK